MAKKMKRILVLCMVLIFSISMIATPAMATSFGGWIDNDNLEEVTGGLVEAGANEDLTEEITKAAELQKNNHNNDSGYYEWYKVYVDGDLKAQAQGTSGDDSWLIQGVYAYSVSIGADGRSLNWVIGNRSGTVYPDLPADYTIATFGDGISYSNADVTGTNSQAERFDNAILTIRILTVYNEKGEEVVPTEPPATEPPATEPPATEPPVVETAVTVIHKYYTYDIYTKDTVLDGETSGSEKAIEGESYTATAVPTYNGNSYTQQTTGNALTITIKADPSENVIVIEYLRTVDTTPVNYTPVLNIIKTADKAVYEHGETITWTITVKNVSEYTAYDVVITDELTGDRWTIASLAPGAEVSFTATTENAASGSIKNVAVASWTDGDEIPDEEEPNEIKTVADEEIVSVNDPAPENYTPVLSVIKTAEKSVYKEGETITWTITVKNVSEYPAYNVVIVDALAKGYWTIDVLAPGAEQSFIVTMENVAAGSVKNVVVVSWEDGDEIPDEEEPNEITETSDEEIVTVEELVNYTPILSITKTANKKSYKVGDTITWTITVKNISEYTAYNVVVTDDLTGESWTVASLAPGAEVSFTATLKNAAAGTVKNVAVVTWEDGDEVDDANEPEEPKSASDEEVVEVKKPNNPVQPTETEPTEPEETEPETPNVPMAQNDEIEIPDEDVPLAEAPKTGDISILWIALSGISAGGMILLGKKREDEE